MANEKLIKAELLSIPVEYIKKHIVAGDSEFLKGYLAGLDAMIAAAAEIPAADAVQVVHGRWIAADYKPYIYCKCSVCGRRVNVSEKDNYCSHCGAKMDGEKRGAE